MEACLPTQSANPFYSFWGGRGGIYNSKIGVCLKHLFVFNFFTCTDHLEYLIHVHIVHRREGVGKRGDVKYMVTEGELTG